MFDLNLLPLFFIDDQEQSDFPGLMAFSPPRRTARGRNGDQLILLLTQTGADPLEPGELTRLVDGLAQRYYQSSGSVTAAMRAVADGLNQALLERNLHAGAQGKQVTGIFNLAVIHGNTIYVAHAGATHTFVIDPGRVDHFTDTHPVTRGLGLSKTITLRFFQSEVQAGDWLVVSPEPPQTWTEAALTGSTSLTTEQFKRRLLNQHQPGLTAGLIQFQPGTGKITRLKPGLSPAHRPQKTPISEPLRQSVPPEPPIPAPSMTPIGRPEDQVDTGAIQAVDAIEHGVDDRPPSIPLASRPAPQPALVEPGVSRRGAVRMESVSRPKTPHPSQTDALRHSMAGLWLGARKIRAGTSRAARRTLARLLPAPPASQAQSLSTGTMVFIAIAVPLIVVAIASTIYFERGKTGQYQQYLTQAQLSAGQVQQQADPALQREAWEKTLYWLDKAESYMTTNESSAMREQAQNALDALDGIARLDFQPAIVGGLGSTVEVSQIVAGSNDLYLLDASQGRVIRGVLTNRGYEVDSAFRCEPGRSGSLMIGELKLIAPMPKGNNFKATLMALDENGNILYCIPGESPLSAPLAPPETGWNAPLAMVFESNTLNLLDTVNNAIWVYAGDGSFVDLPQPFFQSDTPDLKDVVDLAVNNSDIYLLHQDGHLTLCTISYIQTTPTRCTDPVQLTDARPGHQETAAILPNTHFSRILFTQPPDPSIYLMDASSASIYHFSLRLNLQKQMRPRVNPDATMPGSPATAFTISSNRMVFLAFGSKVYYAQIP